MHLCHHRSHPTHIEIATARPGTSCQTLRHITLYRCFPETLVGGIDGKFPGIGGNPHVWMCQHEFTDITIQRKTIDTMACGQHQHGG